MKTKCTAVLISFLFALSAVTFAAAQVSPTFHPSTAPLVSFPSIPNASSTGTTIATLAKLTGVNTALIAATTDNKNGAIIGVVVAGAGTTGSATILSNGVANCAFDGNVTQNDFVTASTSTGGDCHDIGATLPADGSQILGRVMSATTTGAATYLANFNIAPIAGAAPIATQACGTSASCAAPAASLYRAVVFTQIAFSGSTTLALTGMPTFTGTTTYACYVQDTSHPTYTFGTANQSGTATTITASTSNSDSVNVVCIGQ